MTVAELIELLGEYPQDMRIVKYDNAYDDYVPFSLGVTGVESISGLLVFSNKQDAERVVRIA